MRTRDWKRNYCVITTITKYAQAKRVTRRTLISDTPWKVLISWVWVIDSTKSFWSLLIFQEENERTLTVTAWMTLAWIDARLSWLPADYENIKSVHMNIDYIWSPDIYLYNSDLSEDVGKCTPDIDCLVSSEGKIACVMPCHHVGHCSLGDYTNWPFDRQNCSFTFGSWMKTGEEMNYNTERVKLISSRAKENNKWIMLESKSKVNPGVYASVVNETYPSVVFSFLIERHSAFHISGTIVPAIILLVCNLTLLMMTPGSIERFILIISSIFSHFIYMEFLYWMWVWSETKSEWK